MRNAGVADVVGDFLNLAAGAKISEFHRGAWNGGAGGIFHGDGDGAFGELRGESGTQAE